LCALTEALKHRGTYLLVEMKPVTVCPSPRRGHPDVQRVFFEDVRVPVLNRIGEENRGWYVGTTTLDFERSSIGSAIGVRKQLEGLIRTAKTGGEVSPERNPNVKRIRRSLIECGREDVELPR
jgi:alkylation response protein AidB-like acyl-CoA dehydrogenase